MYKNLIILFLWIFSETKIKSNVKITDNDASDLLPYPKKNIFDSDATCIRINKKVEIMVNDDIIKVPYYSKYCGLITKTDKKRKLFSEYKEIFWKNMKIWTINYINLLNIKKSYLIYY